MNVSHPGWPAVSYGTIIIGRMAKTSHEGITLPRIKSKQGSDKRPKPLHNYSRH